MTMNYRIEYRDFVTGTYMFWAEVCHQEMAEDIARECVDHPPMIGMKYFRVISNPRNNGPDYSPENNGGVVVWAGKSKQSV